MNPQSHSVLEKLLVGRKVGAGKGSVGPLDAPTIQLLKLLITHSKDLGGRTGADQAKRLRQLFASSGNEEQDAEPTASPGSDQCDMVCSGAVKSSPRSAHPSVSADADPLRANWRLWRVSCQSIRGVAPPGEIVEFSFDGLSNLIFGPNGSGKSSLMTAVIWALTGQATSDADEHQDLAAIYRVPSGDGKGSKAGDWPILVTLPENGVPVPTAACCWASVEFRGRNDRAVWVRRTYPGTMEISEDGSSWQSGLDLAAFGVSPLDLQLSLLAPTVFGRLSIENAPGTRHLLSLMLGYDDLEAVGELASKLAPNRTKLENAEREDIRIARGDFMTQMNRLPTLLGEKSPARGHLDALLTGKIPTIDEIAKCGKQIADELNGSSAAWKT